ncbi:hypothetical protein [Flavihumibacter petaseus]|uniref:Phosphoribosylpyrophosphate synthetase n=1 Tax=Flavihumibacter petaseus NBRC 106054 TaxID=1220578 RepID=A0A0E9MXX7_9BACT|nr:hypothetical protein [Flavihumibacter petaseus]GAO42429.1 hypothetical protein FPE01S_01_14440 [Flavihumibacter petaseus NBRC 106054]
MKSINALGRMRSLSYCMDKAISRGYSAHFNMHHALLQHADSGKTYQPEQVHVVDFYRFEGVSDPEDNAILYIIETNDGRKGTLADAFGAYADAEVSDFFQAVTDIHKKKTSLEA